MITPTLETSVAPRFESGGLPKRTTQQRLVALAKANHIRSARAQLKRDLKAGKKSIHDILLEPPQWVETMKVFEALIACPKYGRVKVNRILKICKISPAKTIGGLSSRQRLELVSMMRR